MKQKRKVLVIVCTVVIFAAVIGTVLIIGTLKPGVLSGFVNSDIYVTSEQGDTNVETNCIVPKDTETESLTESESAKPLVSDNDGHIVVSYNGEWENILVNRWNTIPEDYTFELMTLDNGRQIDERIYEPLQRMFDDARSQGVYPYISEAYRSVEDQKAMMQSYINLFVEQEYDEDTAKTMAEAYVALPGTSEHELGLALDINADMNVSEDSEAVYLWLAENAYRYGFILRYPEGKEDITGISYEPWHYRYVGEEASKEIHQKGICLEEYLAEKYN